MKTITVKQQKTLNFIEKFISKNGYSPSYREISEKFNVNVSVIQKVVNSLVTKNYLEKVEGISRGFKIVKSEDDIQAEKVKANTIIIPLYGKVAAGEPIFADDNIQGYLTVEKNRHFTGSEFGTVVQGDSMIEKHIVENDILIVRKQNTANDGDIIVALIDDEVTTKIFRKKGKDIYLQPANELYKPIRADFQILGIVVGLTRDFNRVNIHPMGN